MSPEEQAAAEATKPTPELALAHYSRHPNGLVPRIVTARVDGVHGPGEVSMWVKFELVDAAELRAATLKHLSRGGGSPSLAEELEYRKGSELVAILEMAKARREAQDARDCRDTDRMLGAMAGEAAEGQFQALYLRCKELESEAAELRARVANWKEHYREESLARIRASEPRRTPELTERALRAFRDVYYSEESNALARDSGIRMWREGVHAVLEEVLGKGPGDG